MDEKKAGIGSHYPALRAGLLLIIGGAVLIVMLQSRMNQRGGFPEALAFSGYVMEIGGPQDGMRQVRIESDTEEATLAFPDAEAAFLQVGDVVIKRPGETSPALFRNGTQTVPSDFWVSAPVELPQRFATTLDEARRTWAD